MRRPSFRKLKHSYAQNKSNPGTVALYIAESRPAAFQNTNKIVRSDRIVEMSINQNAKATLANICQIQTSQKKMSLKIVEPKQRGILSLNNVQNAIDNAVGIPDAAGYICRIRAIRTDRNIVWLV